MDSDVISVAGPTICASRSPMGEAISSAASTAFSSTDVPPRLFNSTTCGTGPIAACSLATTA